MRSYEVQVTVHSPITLRTEKGQETTEEMHQFLADLLTELAVHAESVVRARLEESKDLAASSGFLLQVPELDEPMGVSYGIKDVTGHVGKKWNHKG